MEYLSISESDMEESRNKIKEVLNKNTKLKAFQFLIEKAKTHSKVNEKLYNDCEGLGHYDDMRFSPDIVNILFKFRTRMYLVKNNFRSNYVNTDTLCPVCKVEEDTQEHLFKCEKIVDNVDENKNCVYEDIFSDDPEKLLNVGFVLKDLIEIRERLLEINTENQKSKGRTEDEL